MAATPRLLAALTGLLLVAGLAGCASPAASPPAATRTAGPPAASPSPTPAASAPAAKATVVALGDSLSRGFDACDHYGDCLPASWVTGSDATVDSLARRTQRTTGAPVAVHNEARSGASVEDLPRQVSDALPLQPTLVTLLIGANDVCRPRLADMTPTSRYERTVDGQLQRLAAGLPDATILVASVPDITNLIPVAAANRTARFLWSHLSGCTTVLGDPLSASASVKERRAAVRQRIDEYNGALEASCATIQQCIWDGGALRSYQPTIAQLSPLDYFHPSIAGLRELAALEWGAMQRRGA